MKPTNLLLAIAVCTIAFTSCKKDNSTSSATDEIETTFELSANQAVADNLTQDDNDVLDEASASNNLSGSYGRGPVITGRHLGDCAIVTVTGNFPTKNIKIDFGTGCTNANGVTRKGIVNILLTDSLRNFGSMATMTFDNYYVNNYKKEGTITWTNITIQGSGQPSWNRKVVDGKITAPNGNFWLHTANITLTMISGASTPLNLTDDVFTINGNRTATNPAGRTRTSTTLTPLQKKTACTNVDKGILQVQGPNHIAVIDFGDGTCDNLATISIDGRPARVIILR
jgi:hypothetical protein